MLKHVFTSAFTLVALLCLSLTAQAQLELPMPSPASMVMQNIGYTEVKVEYSSPAVRGRRIWGEVVAYDQLWRTGANQATRITFSEDVKINNKAVPKGEYSIFTIPSRKGDWTIILNKETKLWGTGAYDQTKDQLRFTATPKIVDNSLDRLAFYVASGPNGKKGTVTLAWEKLRLSFEVVADTKTQAVKKIETSMGQAADQWYDYALAAEYYMNNDVNLENALKWANMSIALREHFFGYWTKARVLKAMGKGSEAFMAAKKAQELGKKTNSGFYKSRAADIQEAVLKWK